MKTIKELKKEALKVLEGKWSEVVPVFLVLFLIDLVINGVSRLSLGAAMVLTHGPLYVGVCFYILNISNNRTYEFNNIFYGFKNIFRSVWASILLFVFTFWRYLLLIVPGVIASLSYSQTYFILADNKNISARESIRMSKKMMNGYKWKYFKLQLSFIGWVIVSLLTLGIGFLWLVPYIKITNAQFYEDLKSQQSKTLPEENDIEKTIEPTVTSTEE